MELNDIWGNEHAKRAIEIALKGNLSIKFIGKDEAEMLGKYCQRKGLNAWWVKPCPCGNFGRENKQPCECETEEIRKQRQLINNYPTDLTLETCNGPLNKQWLEKNWGVKEDGFNLLGMAIERFTLGQSQVLSVLKVARAIADLEGVKDIGINHIAEALQYKQRE